MLGKAESALVSRRFLNIVLEIVRTQKKNALLRELAHQETRALQFRKEVRSGFMIDHYSKPTHTVSKHPKSNGRTLLNHSTEYVQGADSSQSYIPSVGNAKHLDGMAGKPSA